MTFRIYAFFPPCNQYGRQMLSNITRENSTGIISGVMHAKGYYNLSPDFRYIYYHILTHILLPLSPISKKPTLKPPEIYFSVSESSLCSLSEWKGSCNNVRSAKNVAPLASLFKQAEFGNETVIMEETESVLLPQISDTGCVCVWESLQSGTVHTRNQKMMVQRKCDRLAYLWQLLWQLH